MVSGISVIYKNPVGPFIRPVESIKDLAENEMVKIGVFYGGSTYKYLKESSDPTLMKIFDRISQSNLLTNSTAEGVEAVKKGNGDVAFFMETPAAEFNVRNNCKVVKLAEELSHKGYGIALPLGSPYRKELNVAILQLHEYDLEDLKSKWFINPDAQEMCK